jgi:hypothetical protein
MDIPGWDRTTSVDTRNFTCELNGFQCGFPGQVFAADNKRMTITPVRIDGQDFGRAHLDCRRNTGGD